MKFEFICIFMFCIKLYHRFHAHLDIRINDVIKFHKRKFTAEKKSVRGIKLKVTNVNTIALCTMRLDETHTRAKRTTIMVSSAELLYSLQFGSYTIDFRYKVYCSKSTLHIG